MAQLSSLCVYCGSRVGVEQAHRDLASELGAALARSGIRLVFGGGGIGLMGMLADAALAGGGEVVGVIPRHLDRFEVSHSAVPDMRIVASMHERKQTMFDLADAFAILPGGLGTLDEAVEVITWRQLGLHDKPVVLVDHAGYWRGFQALLEHMIGRGFAGHSDTQLFAIASDVAELFAAISAAPEPRITTRPARL